MLFLEAQRLSSEPANDLVPAPYKPMNCKIL